MKYFLNIMAMLFVFGLSTGSFVQAAPTVQETNPVVQGTLMEIDGPFFVIMDRAGKERRVHVDKSTTIIGKMQPGVQVKAEVSKDGHASAVMIVGS